jgi:hypothetical protein
LLLHTLGAMLVNEMRSSNLYRRVQRLVIGLALSLIECCTHSTSPPPAHIPTQQEEQDSLNRHWDAIISFAGSSSCIGTSRCRFVDIGTKRCGGPVAYLIYSTSLDTAKFLAMVQTFDSMQAAFIEKWDIGSDCIVPNLPDSIRCIDGHCRGFWDGQPRVFGGN